MRTPASDRIKQQTTKAEPGSQARLDLDRRMALRRTKADHVFVILRAENQRQHDDMQANNQRQHDTIREVLRLSQGRVTSLEEKAGVGPGNTEKQANGGGKGDRSAFPTTCPALPRGRSAFQRLVVAEIAPPCRQVSPLNPSLESTHFLRFWQFCWRAPKYDGSSRSYFAATNGQFIRFCWVFGPLTVTK